MTNRYCQAGVLLLLVVAILSGLACASFAPALSCTAKAKPDNLNDSSIECTVVINGHGTVHRVKTTTVAEFDLPLD